MKRIHYLILPVLFLLFSGCKKYLEEKSDKKLVVPASLADLQSVLDNYSKNTFSDLGSGEVSTTDYYLTEANYHALSLESYKRMYTWQKTDVFEPASNEWTYAYYSIYAANTVTEGIEKIPRNNTNAQEWDNIKGQALYIRAKTYLSMAYIWTQAYDENSANTDLGLPLRLNTNFNEKSTRSTLAETYAQIINDLQSSAALLPVIPKHLVRPSKPAAHALLARTYLSMRKYRQAGESASDCLKLFDKLIDYKQLTATANYPIKMLNQETIIYSVIPTPTPLNPTRAKINPDLYTLYSNNDLRKTVFFKNNNNGSYAFKGNYTGSLAPFGGISTNEVLLIRAEAHARQNRTEEALKDLNSLLLNRYNSTFIPYSSNSASQALEWILLERRKELPLRGLRWMDIKRLNKEGANISLTRTVNGVVYHLPANDPKFALPIPQDVIQLSGMQQNP